MGVLIREARAEELDRIAADAVEAYQEFARSLSAEDWHGMQAVLESSQKLADGGTFLVAEQDGDLAGSVVYVPPGMCRTELLPESWAQIRLLAVRFDYRGKGVGQRLTERCIDLARTAGIAFIGLYTSDLMVAAQRLYERLGFVRETELPPRHGLRYWRYRLQLRGDS